MSRTITWLHLSDLHAGRPGMGWDARRPLKALLKDLKWLAAEQGLHPDLICFTGDAAFGQVGRGPGQTLAEQFELARQFLDSVCEVYTPSVPRDCLFLVPGNHDVNREAITQADTDWLDRPRDNVFEIAKLLEDKGRDWQHISERLADYRAFLERTGYRHLLVDPDRLVYATVREFHGVRVGIAGLNSAWSCGRESHLERGKLWMGGHWQLERAQAALKDAHVTLALLHHPDVWRVQPEGEELWNAFRRDFRFILHGHEHSAWLTAGADGWTQIAAGACYERSDKRKESGYNLVRLDLETGAGEAWLREYDSRGEGWVAAQVHGRTDGRGVWPLDHLRWLRRGTAPGPAALDTYLEIVRAYCGQAETRPYCQVYELRGAPSRLWLLGKGGREGIYVRLRFDMHPDRTGGPSKAGEPVWAVGRRAQERGSEALEHDLSRIDVSLAEVLGISRHVVLIGAAGCGKSTMLRWVATVLAYRDLGLARTELGLAAEGSSVPIPLYVALRNFEHACQTEPQKYQRDVEGLLRFVDDHFRRWHPDPRIPTGFLSDLVHAGRARTATSPSAGRSRASSRRLPSVTGWCTTP